MFKKSICICITLILLTSCSDENQKKTVDDLKNQINQMQNQISQLYSQINDINRETAVFTPGAKGYQIIHTDTGNFVVSLEKLNEYANGYEATFYIGNPNLITYDQIELQASWGKITNDNHSPEDWVHSLQSESVQINKSLLPGMWNKVTIVLSPATAEETGIIFLTIKTNTIHLSHDNRKDAN